MSTYGGLFDALLHDDVAQGRRLKQLSRRLSGANRRRARNEGEARRAIEGLEDDVALLALLLLAQLKRLMENGTLSKGELLASLEELDALDGEEDGGLAPDTLRDVLGIEKPEPARPDPPRPRPVERKKPRRKRRR